MAFIVLRRSRDTKNYYLVESYRDADGRSRKRTLCYLGREQDGTDTIEKAIAHWRTVSKQCAQELRKADATRKAVLRRKRGAAEARIAILNNQLREWRHNEQLRLERLRLAEAAERKRRRQAEEAVHWQAFDTLRRHPSQEHARGAKRAFLTLAKLYHPDQGGTHEEFLKLKETYDGARSYWD